MLPSEHLYCVSIAFKTTEQIQQQICIKFCVKLEHSSMETVPMIQKASAMRNWWLAASSWQCACSCITSSAEFFCKTSNHPGDSAPLNPTIGILQLLDFPKTKITFEREEISDCQWDSGKYHGAPDCDPIKDFAEFWTVEETLGELCEVPRCLLCRGLKCLCYNVSCILYLFQ